MKRILLTNMIAAGMASFCIHVIAAPADQRDQRGEQVTTALDQKELAVTIYNNDLALVKDARRVNLERELNKLAWRGVSAQMRPETALLRNTSHPTGFRLQEQNFDFDLLTPESYRRIRPSRLLCSPQQMFPFEKNFCWLERVIIILVNTAMLAKS